MPPIFRHDVLPLATAQIRPGPWPVPSPREAAAKARQTQPIQTFQVQISQTDVTDGDGGYVVSLVLLTVGLIILVACGRLAHRQLKTPRARVRDLALTPTGQKVRVRATVHSANPLEAGPDGSPALYTRISIVERQSSHDTHGRRQTRYVEIAAQPSIWANDCFLRDESGQISMQWSDASPSLVEQNRCYRRHHAENNPRIAALFEQFLDRDRPTSEPSLGTRRLNNELYEQFIPDGAKLTLWGHCEEDFEVPGGRRFHATEIEPASALNFWSRVVFGVFLGVALCLGALLFGIQTFQTHEANAPVYTPTAGPTPLKP